MMFKTTDLRRYLTSASLAAIALLLLHGVAFAGSAARKAGPIIEQIRFADYAGDRAAMQKGYDNLLPLLKDTKYESRIRYWRGFAQWRRGINGFNDSVDPKELQRDLKTALGEFRTAMTLDSTFVDAKVGAISCLGFLAYMHRDEKETVAKLIAEIMPLVKKASSLEPDNPRLIWVRGPILWNTPPGQGGGQDKAIENYLRGLEVCAKIKPGHDPLEPSWGEPELMMSLSYSYLNTTPANVDAAERYARDALRIVPHWHYVRDILLPQIVAARKARP